MAPRAVLMKTGLKSVNTARPVNTVRSVNTGRPFSTARSFNTVRPSYTAYPKSTNHCARPRTYFQNQAQSTVHRPFYKRTALTNRCFNQRFNTGRPFRSTVNTVRARGFNAVKPSACWVWRPIKPNGASLSNSQLNDKGFVDSGCSRHMTGNITHLSDFKDFDGGYVTFGGGAYGGRITGKGTIKTDNLDFDDVYFVKELKFNLFSVSQMCDKKNYVLFTDSECLVLSPNFKLPDENQILLKIPRQDNMYSFDMKNIVPKDSLTCLVAKATSEESMLWHRRLGHVNFKNINKLVKENLVRDLPLKRFENDQTCVACLKGKQHRASCKTKAFNPITKPLFMLHMDLFGPTFRSAEASTDDNGEVQIAASIDGHSMSITEASLRRHLKLDDQDGITSIPNLEIFEQLALMGYHTDSDKLTFQKGAFSPQWRFLIHNILHCLSPKKTAWEKFSSNIATARNQLQQHSRTYHVPSLSIKVFNNMKRPTKGYSGQEVALFPSMLDVSEPSTSPSRITSSPSYSPEPSPSPEPSFEHSPDHTTAAASQPSPTQPLPTQPSPTQPLTGAEHHFPIPHDLPLHVVHSYGRKAKSQGRILSDAEVQEKASNETEPVIQDVTPTEVIQDQESSEKGSAEVSTARAKQGTASEEVPIVSTAEVNLSTAGGKLLLDTRRSAEKRSRQDKGKAIMIESEPKKKSKKELEQERFEFAEASA
ncbi:putative ribonuclease H-like domain-containing protein [Tanacetum coccineum]